MYLTWKQFINYILLRNIRLDRKHLKNKKNWAMYFEKEQYYAKILLKELHSLNLYVYPSEEEMQAYCKQYCANLQKIPRRVNGFSDTTLWLTLQPRIRRAIEILSMLKYPPTIILEILTNNHLVNKHFDVVYLQEYLSFFFNLEEMSCAEKDMFFARVRTEQIPYYKIHIGVHYGTLDEETALASLGLEVDAVNNYNIPNRLGRLIKILCIKMDAALIEDDLSQVQHLSNSISSLANSFSRLGGEQEQKSHSLSDYVKLMVVPREETLTVEDIREH
ncbi:MAG: hypothetical protein KC649_03910, partial [Candidatus Omnitrophica bacterium]|nr:hypothetical protein [Candidatus Omnitrophota bacterium]